jgi:hypothetical protein
MSDLRDDLIVDAQAPSVHGYDIPTGELRCCQCGRAGSRGFKLTPGVLERTGDETDLYIVCVNEKACRKRWPVESEDAADARLA